MTDLQIIDILAEQLLRIEKKIRDKETKFIFTKITRVDNGRYYAKINGTEYELPNSTNMDFSVSSNVIVCIPNNELRNKFIIGKF